MTLQAESSSSHQEEFSDWLRGSLENYTFDTACGSRLETENNLGLNSLAPCDIVGGTQVITQSLADGFVYPFIPLEELWQVDWLNDASDMASPPRLMTTQAYPCDPFLYDDCSEYTS